MVAMHIVRLEDMLLGEDIDEPPHLLELLLCVKSHALVFHLQLLPDVIELVIHLERSLELIAHLAAGSGDGISKVQVLLKVFETVDEIVDGNLRRTMQKESETQFLFDHF